MEVFPKGEKQRFSKTRERLDFSFWENNKSWSKNESKIIYHQGEGTE